METFNLGEVYRITASGFDSNKSYCFEGKLTAVNTNGLSGSFTLDNVVATVSTHGSTSKVVYREQLVISTEEFPVLAIAKVGDTDVLNKLAKLCTSSVDW